MPAEDFIELGLEGADKLIDKHFHKVPDKYVDPNHWKPHRHRKGSKDNDSPTQSKNNRDRQRDSKSDDSGYYDDYDQRRMRRSSAAERYSPLAEENMAAASTTGRPLNDANSGPYFEDGPFITPPFTAMPDPHRSNLSPQFSPRDSRRDDVYSQAPRDDYHGRPTTHMRRRSSSYHGPRRGDDFYSSDSDDEASDNRSSHHHHRSNNQQQLATRTHHTGKDSSTRDRSRESGSGSGFRALTDNFTDSKEGLAGGALGALVGGFVTHKALESRGHHGRKDDKDAMWTVLGAAVGGLAVNAVVDKWEDKKKGDRKEVRRGREREVEKYGGGGGGGGGGFDNGGRARSERGGRGVRDWDSDYEERRYYR